MLAAAQRSLPGLARGEVAPPPDTRVRHLTVALGATGMGKSWLARKALEEWKENNPTAPIYQIGKGHIWVAGAGTDKQLLFPEVIALTNNGMGPSAVRMNPRIPLEGGYVMLDDGDAAIPKTIADTPWYEFCWEHRHLRIDGWLNAHRPQRIDKDWIQAAHFIYVFSIGEVNAYKYLADLISEFEGQDVMDENFLDKYTPHEQGQAIKIIKDPKHKGKAKVEFWDFIKGVQIA